MPRMPRPVACIIEPLESRRFFSAAAPSAVAALVSPPHVAVKLAPAGTGVTLQLQAGVGFTGEVAFIPSPASGLGPSANIDWGDGTTTQATLQTVTQNGVTGYDVIGSHTYADPGTYSILTTMVLTPISQPGQPTPEFIVADPPVVSTAIVSPATGTSPVNPATPGVTIHEIAGDRFTADLGSFTTVAPGRHLRATIDWGDGKTSVGKLVPSGVVGLDEVTLDVSGTHKYVHPGTYGIAVRVIRLPIGASLAIQDIATFDAIANVSANPR
jgi:hypothetical protein